MNLQEAEDLITVIRMTSNNHVAANYILGALESERVNGKLKVRANPKCAHCLGSAIATGLFIGTNHVCSCVTEQLAIVTVPKDYSIVGEERYLPSKNTFIMEELDAKTKK